MTHRAFRSTALGILLCCGAPLVGHCPVLAGEYHAGKTGSLDLQLEQERKRTAEMDDEIKRTKEGMRDLSVELGELSAQVQVARDQMARLQQEVEAINESGLLRPKATEDIGRRGQDLPGRRHRSKPTE